MQRTYLDAFATLPDKVQQLRIWDESGNHIEPNLTMDPNAMPDKFPGGTGVHRNYPRLVILTPLQAEV